MTTKIKCTVCKGHGVTSPAGKSYRNPANAVASIPCKSCVKAPAKSTGFVKAKIRAAKEAKLREDSGWDFTPEETAKRKANTSTVEAAKRAPRKATVKVTPASKRVTVTMSESEYAAFAAMMNTPRTASGKGRRTSKATPNSRAAVTSHKAR